jgi:hypothetical protein
VACEAQIIAVANLLVSNYCVLEHNAYTGVSAWVTQSHVQASRCALSTLSGAHHVYFQEAAGYSCSGASFGAEENF